MEKDQVTSPEKILVIGGSAGSLDVLFRVLPLLDVALGVAIIIVLHRKNTNDSILSLLLSNKTKLRVKEADEKEVIMPGTIYIAPSDYHLLIEEDRTLSLDASEKINYSRPSIDVTFECAAEVYKAGATCLLLSGTNADGVDGLKAVKRNKGIAAVQDPDSAEFSYMPQLAIRDVNVDFVLKIEEMPVFINNLAAR